MFDGITYKAGQAFKHFVTERQAVAYMRSKEIWNYRMRFVSLNGMSNVRMAWTPEPGSIRADAYPEISDVDGEMRRRWSAQSHTTHHGWQLHHHEEWLWQGTFDALSRFVLIQGMAFVTFAYRTGDAAARTQAEHDALQFANANAFATRHVGKFYFFASPAVVYFTAPLGAAGWVTGDTATVLLDLIERNQSCRLDAVLSDLAGYIPKDYTTTLEAVLNIHEAEFA